MSNQPRTPSNNLPLDNKTSMFVMEIPQIPPNPWNPSPYKSRTVLVEGGVQAKQPAYEFIVLNRERDRISELKAGRYALTRRQMGFARLDDCLVYKDKAGEFHYMYNSGTLKDQLYIKEPVATPEYLPPTDSIGTLRYVHSEDQYYMLTENEDGAKEWLPVTAHTDKRLDEEIARAIARENEIEGKAQGISIRIANEETARKNEDDALQSWIDNERQDRINADAELNQRVQALGGALIYIGAIGRSTDEIAADNALLNDRVAELGKNPKKTGYVLVDSDGNNWWYNEDTDSWANIGYYQVATTTNSSLGVVKGVSDDGTPDTQYKVSVDGEGKMAVNGLENVLLQLQDNAQHLNSEINENTHAINGLQESKQDRLQSSPTVIVNSNNTLTAVGAVRTVQFMRDPRDDKIYRCAAMPDGKVWMAENLDYDKIGGVYYDNAESPPFAKAGRLYTWLQAMAAAPPGWHLPTDAEWTALALAAGGAGAHGESGTAGTVLKAMFQWFGKGSGTDAYGFAALPGGSGDTDGTFDYINSFGGWWSASTAGTSDAYRRSMGYYGECVYRHLYDMAYKFSVRCVQN